MVRGEADPRGEGVFFATDKTDNYLDELYLPGPNKDGARQKSAIASRISLSVISLDFSNTEILKPEGSDELGKRQVAVLP